MFDNDYPLTKMLRSLRGGLRPPPVIGRKTQGADSVDDLLATCSVKAVSKTDPNTANIRWIS